MFRYVFVLIAFVFISCSTTKDVKIDKVYENAEINYDKIWIEKIKNKSVVAPNGYMYKFKDNGDVEYSALGAKSGVGFFVKALSETNAYYYEKVPMKNLIYYIKGIKNFPDKNIDMYVSFIIETNGIKMTKDYTDDYYKKVNDWRKTNLDIYGVLKNDGDLLSYPVPSIEEVDLNNTIYFGNMR